MNYSLVSRVQNAGIRDHCSVRTQFVLLLALTTEKLQNMSSYWHRRSVIGTDLIVGWLVEHTDAAPAATANILPMLTKALNTVLKNGRKTQQI